MHLNQSSGHKLCNIFFKIRDMCTSKHTAFEGLCSPNQCELVAIFLHFVGHQRSDDSCKLNGSFSSILLDNTKWVLS